MFYILMIIGITSIVLGNVLERRYLKSSEEILIDEEYDEKTKNPKEIGKSKEETLDLEKRLKILEEMLFSKILKEEISSFAIVENESTQKETNRKEDSIEKYKLIKEYEKRNKDIDEIAKLLEINKGEVLLLKNLYKNL